MEDTVTQSHFWRGSHPEIGPCRASGQAEYPRVRRKRTWPGEQERRWGVGSGGGEQAKLGQTPTQLKDHPWLLVNNRRKAKPHGPPCKASPSFPGSAAHLPSTSRASPHCPAGPLLLIPLLMQASLPLLLLGLWGPPPGPPPALPPPPP